MVAPCGRARGSSRHSCWLRARVPRRAPNRPSFPLEARRRTRGPPTRARRRWRSRTTARRTDLSAVRPRSARMGSTAAAPPVAGRTGPAASRESAARRPSRIAAATTSRSTRPPTVPVGRTRAWVLAKRSAKRSTTSPNPWPAARSASAATTAAGDEFVSGPRAAAPTGRASGGRGSDRGVPAGRSTSADATA